MSRTPSISSSEFVVLSEPADDDLDLPAAEYLANVPWWEEGPDPDELDAQSFLALL
jgi:hypothetical protein